MGNTVVVSSHYVEAFEPYLDQVTLLHNGEVLLDEPRDELDIGDASSLRRDYLERVLDTEDSGSVERNSIE